MHFFATRAPPMSITFSQNQAFSRVLSADVYHSAAKLGVFQSFRRFPSSAGCSKDQAARCLLSLMQEKRGLSTTTLYDAYYASRTRSGVFARPRCTLLIRPKQ